MPELNGIVLGYADGQILELDIEDFGRVLIVSDYPESYTFYLLERLSCKFLLAFYSLKNVSSNVLNNFHTLNLEHLLPNLLVFDGLTHNLSSRILAEAFKHSFNLSEEEFLLLHNLLLSLLKQSSKLNLLHIISSVKSFSGNDLSFLEKNAALKLEWRLQLIDELFPYIIGGKDSIAYNGNLCYNLSQINSLEGKILTLLLLLSKNFLYDRSRIPLIFLGHFPDYAKVYVVKFIQFLQNIVEPIPIILSCRESFPLKYLNFFDTLIFDKTFLELCETNLKTFCRKSGCKGELFYIRGDNAIQFFYDSPKLNTFEERSLASKKFVEDHALVQRILEVIANYPNVTRQGLVQSLSIDHSSEVIEYVLNELIEKGYVIVEVEKNRRGLFAKLSISMDGRALLSKKKGV
ncbi:MAG: hypothetical protein N3F64_02600 [Nitrososphaeria archaeon]|nr:hypothetical protein [Nitrososphaeria archaeon]